MHAKVNVCPKRPGVAVEVGGRSAGVGAEVQHRGTGRQVEIARCGGRSGRVEGSDEAGMVGLGAVSDAVEVVVGAIGDILDEGVSDDRGGGIVKNAGIC